MPAKMVEITAVKLECSRCQVKAVGMQSHVGRKHARCSGHVAGLPRQDGGNWKEVSW